MSMLSRFATLGGAPPDPYFANVSLLVVGNGTNGTTTNIKDSSSNNVAITISGSTVISTAQSKFGSGSVLFDGTGDYLTGTTAGINLGTSNFTIECWFHTGTLSNNSYPGIFDSRASNFLNGLLICGYLGGLGVYNGTFILTASSSQVPFNQWVHMAVVRTSGTSVLYLQGNAVSSASDTSNYINPGFFIGSTRDNNAYQGYIYDFRITKGIARYTANYTPPPFPPTAPMPTYGP